MLPSATGARKFRQSTAVTVPEETAKAEGISHSIDSAVVPASDAPTPSVTLVTGFFFLHSNPRSMSVYKRYIGNFVSRVETPMVIYTQSPDEAWFRSERGSLLTRWRVYASIWNLPPVAHLRPAYDTQRTLDPEHAIHSGDMYAAYNFKPWALADTAANNPFDTPYFMWVDAGCFRLGPAGFTPSPMVHWPSADAMHRATSRLGDSVLLEMVQMPQNATYSVPIMQPVQQPHFIAGGFVLGNKRAVTWFARTFYGLHDAFLRHGKFVGKEQDVYNALVLKHPNRVLLLDDRLSSHVSKKNATGCEIRWYMHWLIWFASDKELQSQPEFRDCPRHRNKIMQLSASIGFSANPV